MIKQAYILQINSVWRALETAPSGLIYALNNEGEPAKLALDYLSYSTVAVNDTNDVFVFELDDDSRWSTIALVTDKNPGYKALEIINLADDMEIKDVRSIIEHPQQVILSQVFDKPYTRIEQLCFITYTIYKNEPQKVSTNKVRGYISLRMEHHQYPSLEKLKKDKIIELLSCPLRNEYGAMLHKEYWLHDITIPVGGVYVGENDEYKRYLVEVDPDMYKMPLGSIIDTDKLFKAIKAEEAYHND